MKTLFHGSSMTVDKPVIVTSNRFLDYGTGFYTTADRNQAIRFTEKFSALGRGRVLNTYEFNERDALEKLAVKEFPEPNFEWLEYVVANRSGKGLVGDFDLVIGPVANDRVYRVVEIYEAGDYTADEAIRRLKTFLLVNQVTFKSDAALEYLVFTSSESIGAHDD